MSYIAAVLGVLALAGFINAERERRTAAKLRKQGAWQRILR